MKKVFKSLMVGALAIPCAFAFTGCGDNGVNVNTSGNYKAVEATAAYAEIDSLVESESLNFNGVRFTLIEKASDKNMSGEVKLNGTAIFSQDNVEFAITVTTKANSPAMNIDASMSLYMKDNVLYIQAGDEKFKVDTTTVVDPDLGDYTQYLEMVPTDEMMTAALSSISDYVSVSEKSDVNGVVKYHFKGEDTQNGTSEYWLVIKEGKFDGFKGNSETTSQGTTLTESINIERYTSEINFPSFDGYTDYTAMIG